jgi:hypothetical protein
VSHVAGIVALFEPFPSKSDHDFWLTHEPIANAHDLIEAVQRNLFGRVGKSATLYEEHVTTIAMGQALDRLGATVAKRVQLEASNGEPLAICGAQPSLTHPVGFWHETRGKKIAALPRGCRVIFEDNTRTTAVMFARYCPNCSNPRRDARRRAEKRAIRRAFPMPS